MESNKINFTKNTILSLSLPEHGKIAYYYDVQVSGLGIMIFNSGTKTFFLYKRINGRPDKIKIGRFPEITIEQARKQAYLMINDITLGVNPKEEKIKHKKSSTLAELYNNFMEQHSKLHKKTWKEDIYNFDRYLISLANKRAKDITKSSVIDWQTKIAKNYGIYAANHSLALLSVIYNKSIEWGFDGTNPCTGIKKFKEKSRERFLQSDELPRFFEALDNEPNELFKDYIYISLLTGARRSNVLAMSWKDINSINCTWRIEETKNGEPQTIHLSDYTIEILNKRAKDRYSDWVFPSSTSKSGHIEEPKKIWQRVLEKAGIEDLRIHDLRRTLGSWQAATGANSYVIGKSLGHKTQQATAIYARLNLDQVRESVNKATNAMFEAAARKEIKRL
jgi:integrase